MKQNIGNRRPGPRIKRRSTAPLQAAIWNAMRRNRNGWTSVQIASVSGCSLSTVQQYIAALKRCGLIECVALAINTQSGAVPGMWRVCSDAPKTAPMVRWSDRTAYTQDA